MKENSAYFRFYGELNDFLPGDRRKKDLKYEFNGNPSVKDAIEAIGIPHTEIDLILVNSCPVNFEHILKTNDRVSVYPVFESIDISTINNCLRPGPLREIKFVVDVQLGKLLRLFGFDTLYRDNYKENEIIGISLSEKRIILTRNTGLLKNRRVTHGYWVRSQLEAGQLEEVFSRFDLYGQIQPFKRCIVCNGILDEVEKNMAERDLLPDTKLYFNEFKKCSSCGRVYWKGSHYQKMAGFIGRFIENCKKISE